MARLTELLARTSPILENRRGGSRVSWREVKSTRDHLFSAQVMDGDCHSDVTIKCELDVITMARFGLLVIYLIALSRVRFHFD